MTLVEKYGEAGAAYLLDLQRHSGNPMLIAAVQEVIEEADVD